MTNYSEEHLRRRKQYQKKYMQRYRAAKRAERMSRDPDYAERSSKWRAGHEKIQKMTDLERELHYMEQNNASNRRKERERVDARCAVDPEYAAYVAKWRAARAACDRMTDDELAKYKRQKRREYSARTRTKQAEQSRECRQQSAQMLSELSGCTSEP
jgi:hypothetical protein